MKKELLEHVPDWVLIDASLETFSIGDEFGDKVFDLMRKLREVDPDSVWTKRLALFEIARRKAWIRSFLSLSDKGYSGLMYPRFALGEIQRISQPGRVINWKDLSDELSGKDVVLEHGSYRSIPTMAHVGYVNYGCVGSIGANLNLLSLDSMKVIKRIKGDNKIVLSDDLRTEFWRHVPGVDLVVVTPEFDPEKVQNFWVEETYPKISGYANSLTLMCSYGDQIAEEKHRHARLNKRMDVRVVYREDWNREFGHPLYPSWTTSQWDEASDSHVMFENLARQYLVNLG